MRIKPGLLMINRTRFLLGGVGAAAFSIAAANAAVLIPVRPLPHSTSTMAFGINDSGNITGSYVRDSDGLERGFAGPLNGKYEKFDAGVGGTRPLAINNAGYIAGYSNSQLGETDTQPIFERKPGGKRVNVTENGAQLFGAANGISNSTNKFAGDFWDRGEFAIDGFIGHKGRWSADIGLPGNYQFSSATGINSSNVVAGYGATDRVHGVILVHNKNAVAIDYPDAATAATEFHGINDNGQVSGQWWDSNNIPHGFVYDIASSTFTEINVKGATRVRAWGINSAGAVAVTSNVGSFIWCPTDTGCPAAGGVKVDAPTHKGLPLKSSP
jgi:hypothetical protein